MAYALDILEQIIDGNLAPWLFPEETEKQALWQEYLQTPLSQATRQIHASFGKKTDHAQLDVQNVDIRLLDRRQPPAFVQLEHQVQQPTVSGEVLLDQLIEQLSLDPSTLQQWYHWQDEAGFLHLEAYVQVNWENLSFEEQRFSFFQQVLAEKGLLFEEKLKTYVHQSPSRLAVEKYMQDHQKALLRFCEKLIEQLGADQSVYGFSHGYLLTDVARLILHRVEKLMAFLIQQYAEYLDQDTPVPYTHKVLMLSQHKVLLEELSVLVSDQVLDAALQRLLQEVLSTFKALPQLPASLRQLAYWQLFLPQLENLLKDKTLLTDEAQEYYLLGLSAINFNQSDFIAWGIALIEQEISYQESTAGKLAQLYYFQKRLRQVRINTELSFDAAQKDAPTQFLGWITEEISYQQNQATQAPALSASQERIPTNMTVAQLALLLRLLRESELLPEQNKARMFRAFSQLLLSHKGEEISPDSLRGKYFQHDEHTMSIMRERLIEMLDFLDGL